MDPNPASTQPTRPTGLVSDVNTVRGDPSALWRYFDKVYCVSLDERPDRRDMARCQFELVGLSRLVEFVIVKKHPGSRERGIFESHMTCLDLGLEARASNILVFEDDIVFEGFAPTTLQRCVNFMADDTDWDAFFFGCLTKKIALTRNPAVVRVVYRSLAHAYAVRRAFAEQIISQQWRDIPFDSMLARLSGNYYAVYPGFAFQSGASSDNHQQLNRERFRNLCGGLRRIQKANEFYNFHKSAIVLIHLVVLLAILIFLFWL